MNCAVCGYVSEFNVGSLKVEQCPRCAERASRLRFARHNFVKVHTASGRALEFNRIKLYDLALFQQIEQLRQAAAKNLSGYSSGTGFYGDVGSVAAASLVTGLIEGAVSGHMQGKGLNQLGDAAELVVQLHKSAEFVDVLHIKNIEHPDPSLWHAAVPREQTKRELIHLPNNLVRIEADGVESVVFWDKIEQYELIKKY